MPRTRPQILCRFAITAALLAGAAGCVLDSFVAPPALRPEGYCLGQGSVFSIAFSPDGKQLASSHCGLGSARFRHCCGMSMIPQIRLWEAGHGPSVPVVSRAAFQATSPQWERWDFPTVKFSADGRFLFAERLGLLRWNIAEQRLDTVFDKRHVVLSQDGRTVAVESPEAEQRRLNRTFAFYFGPVTADTGEDKVELLDTETGTLKRVLSYKRPLGFFFAFTPDDKSLALHAEDGRIGFLDIETGTVRRPAGLMQWGWPHTFSKDGCRYAAQAPKETIQVWDIATGAPLASIKVGADIWCLAFSPDGTQLAVGREGDERAGEIQLWDVAAAGKLLVRVQDESTWGITALAFSPDGTTLASGCGKGEIKYWSVKDLLAGKKPEATRVLRVMPTP